MRKLLLVLTIFGVGLCTLASQESSQPASRDSQPAGGSSSPQTKNENEHPRLTADREIQRQTTQTTAQDHRGIGQGGLTKLKAKPVPGRPGLGAIQAPAGRGTSYPQFHKPSPSVSDINRAVSGNGAGAPNRGFTTTAMQQNRFSSAPAILPSSGLRPSHSVFTPGAAPAILDGSTIHARPNTALINGTGLKHKP
jgi:hypothetical protein